MRVAVVGCGAVGSYYGACLCRAGQQVHFLLRSDYEVVRQRGVQIQSVRGDFQARPFCAARPEDIGPCDLVLVALKTTANSQFPVLLPPLVGPQTVVLTLQNGLGNEEALARLFPANQILGGLCFVCLNRIAPGVIRHIDHGRVVIGEFVPPAGPRTHALAAAFLEGGVPCEVTDDLACAHWEKLVWNIPFNGLGVAGVAGYEALINPAAPLPRLTARPVCLATDALLADARWAGLVRELMAEVIAAANGLGFALQPALADRMIALTRTMAAYKASTLLDFEHGLPLELEGLFLEPLRRARQAGVPTPRLEALCRVLTELDASRAAALRQARVPTGCPPDTAGAETRRTTSPFPPPSSRPSW